MGLAGCADLHRALLAAADDSSEAVRVGVLLALRRQGRRGGRALSPGCSFATHARGGARDLRHADRARDAPAGRLLAAEPDLAEPVLRRAINANYYPRRRRRR